MEKGTPHYKLTVVKAMVTGGKGALHHVGVGGRGGA